MSEWVPLITGSGGALVVLALGLYLFLTGKLHSHSEFRKLEAENTALRQENNQYRFALDVERKTVNEAANAGQVTNQLITALTNLAAGRKPKTEGLSAGDLGL